MKGDKWTNVVRAYNNKLRDKLNDLEYTTINYALVTFGPKADAQGWSTTAPTLPASPNPSGSEGTNYQDAMIVAKRLLNESKTDRPNATQVVLFLTDGQPYGYNDTSNNDVYIGGNEYKDEAKILGVVEAEGLSAARFYAIAYNLANDESKYLRNEFMPALKVPLYSKRVYDVKNASDLNNVFAQIGGSLDSLLCSNVKIVDNLSENVQPKLTKEGKIQNLKIEAQKRGNTDPSQVQSIEAGGASTVVLEFNDPGYDPGFEAGKLAAIETKITAKYDSTTRQVTLEFDPDYTLNPEYEFTVTITVEPTDVARKKVKDSGYTDIPDVNTGTHSEPEIEKGLFSNQEGSKVTYTYNGTSGEQDFKKPVIQVKEEKGTIKITKTVDAPQDDDQFTAPTSYTFEILDSAGSKKGTVTVNSFENGTGSATSQELEAGTYTVKEVLNSTAETATTAAVTGANVDGYDLTTTYADREATGTYSDNTGVTVTIPAGGEEKISFTNSYKRKEAHDDKLNVGGIDLTLTKTGEAGTEKLGGATFALYSDEECTTPVDSTGVQIKATTSSEDTAKGTLNLQIPVSMDDLDAISKSVTYYLKEEMPPEGYKTGDVIVITATRGDQVSDEWDPTNSQWIYTYALDVDVKRGDEKLYPVGNAGSATVANNMQQVSITVKNVATYTNESYVGTLHLKKVGKSYEDPNGDPIGLEGAVFKLTKKGANRDQDVVLDSNIKSTSDGTFDIDFSQDGYLDGTYILEETQAPSTYQLNKDPEKNQYTIVVTKGDRISTEYVELNGTATWEEEYQLDITFNDEAPTNENTVFTINNGQVEKEEFLYKEDASVTLTVLKTDDNETPTSEAKVLAGAVFTVYTDKECENVLQIEDVDVKATTNENGEAEFTFKAAAWKENNIISAEERRFYLKETKAPAGYDKTETVYEVIIKKGCNLTDEEVEGKARWCDDDATPKCWYQLVEMTVQVKETGTSSTQDPVAAGTTADLKVVNKADQNQKYTVIYKVDDAQNGWGGVQLISSTEDPTNEVRNKDLQVLDDTDVTGAVATAAEGYKFDGWYKDSTKIDTETEGTLDAETAKKKLNKDGDIFKDTTYVAKFKKDDTATYKVTYEVMKIGEVEPGTVDHKEQEEWVRATTEITGSTATANDGYEFVGWYKGAANEIDTTQEPLSKEAKLTGTTLTGALNYDEDKAVYQNTTFTAVFKIKQIDIQVNKSWNWNNAAERATEEAERPDYTFEIVLMKRVLDPTGQTYELVPVQDANGEYTIVLSDNNDWEGGKFEGLPVVDKDGKKIEYTVKEFITKDSSQTNMRAMSMQEEVPYAPPVVTGNATSGFIVTNTWNRIKVKLPDVEYTYDGTDIFDQDDTRTPKADLQEVKLVAGTLKDGDKIKVEYRANATDVTWTDKTDRSKGVSTVKLTNQFLSADTPNAVVTIVDKNGVPVPDDKYTLEVIDGSYQINPRPVTLYVEDATKVYGQNDPESFKVKVEAGNEDEGLITADQVRWDNGEEVIPFATWREKWDAAVTGYTLDNDWNRLEGRESDTDDGKKTVYLYNPDAATLSGNSKESVEAFKTALNNASGNSYYVDNYDVTYKNGTLTIEKRKLTIAMGSKSITYSELQKLPGQILTLDPKEGDVWAENAPDPGGLLINCGFEKTEMDKLVNVKIKVEAGLAKVGKKPVTKEDIDSYLIQRNPVVTSNYDITFGTGTLEVIGDTPVTVTPPTVTPSTTPAPAPTYVYVPYNVPVYVTEPIPADGAAVLGARRDVTVDAPTEGARVLGARRDAGEAVLGARKSETGDTPLTKNYMMLMIGFMGLLLLNADSAVVYLADRRRRARRAARK